MLVAPKQSEFIYEPTLTVPKKHKCKRLCIKQKCSIALLIVCTFLIGLALTSQVASFVYQGYEVSKLEKEIAALQTANERLKLEIEELCSLDRVENLAVNQLGMVKPDIGDYQFILVEEKDAFTSEAMTKNPTRLSSEDEKQAEMPLLAAWTKKFSSMFIGLVEASEL